MALLTMQEYLEKKKKDDELQHAISYVEYMRQNEIAPVKLTNKPSEITAPSLSDKKDKDEGLLDFFQKGAFEDGYQFGDVTKSILGTTGDAVVGVAKGIGSLGEGIVDLGKYGVAGVADVIGKDKYAEQVRKNAQENSVEEFFKGTDDYLNQYSVLGRTSDAVMQGVGQVGAIILTGGVAGALGAGAVGATVATSGLMGLSSAGSGMSEAYKGGATDKEATIYGISKGVIDAGSELIFGGLGKAVNAVGLSKGISSLDDVFAQKLSSKLSNQVAKNFAEFGVKASAEGFEEVIAGLGSAVAKKLTYMDEEELGQIVKDENLLEQFVVGTVTSGMIQSGYIPAAAQGSLKEANETGTDFITGYTQNEQAVIDKEVENRIKERETDGKKLTNKEISSIEEQVKKDLDKGYINIDTIESTLGGETYNKYKSLTEQEETLTKKLEELEKAPNTVGNAKQYEETQKQLEELKNKYEKTKIKEQLSKEVKEMTLTDRLSESYNERARRGQNLEVDVESYKNESAKQTAQNFSDFRDSNGNGVNNTNATHDYLDLVTKVAEDRGHTFKFMTTKQLEESIANGNPYNITEDAGKVEAFVSGSTKEIVINMDANKSLTSLVGHEVMHTLEKANSYSDAQNALFEYAKTKGEYEDRWASIQRRYSNLTEEQQKQELTSDLVGDYVFGDTDFISNLSTENPNIFKKIYNEIKYLWKMATAGSKEARELERVKREFEKIWAEAYNADLESGNISEAEEVSDAEVNSILEQNGVQPVHRQGGDVGLDKFGFNEDGSVKYSIADSDGNQLTKEQQEYFKDSKVRDENGNLKVMYHGTGDAGFHKFDTDYSNDARSLFFTDSNTVAKTYSGTRYEYSAKTLKTVDDLNGLFAEIDATEYEAREENGKFVLYEDGDEIATSDSVDGLYDEYRDWTGDGYGNANYKVYLNLKNPLVVDAKENYWNELHQASDRNTIEYTNIQASKMNNGDIGIEYSVGNDDFYENLSEEDFVNKFGEELLEEIKNTEWDVSKEQYVVDADTHERVFATTREYSEYAKKNGYDGVIFKNIYDTGLFGTRMEQFTSSTVAVAFDSNQIKSVANAAPTSNADIRYSLSEDGSEIKTDRVSEVQYSLKYDAQYMDNAIANNNSKLLVDKKIMEDVKTIRAKIAARMEEIKDKGLVGLPEDIEGNTFISNSSYGGTEENTTICPRSLSAEAFVDAVSEMMGRPLTVEEQIYISQDLQGRSLTPECTYCYVATDRKAYRAFLGEYISQRDSVIEKVKNNPDADVSRNGELYQEFLNGRKDTNPMYKRFKMWVDAYKNGIPMVDANHLSNMGKLMGDINSEFGAELKPQITDAMKYAQSASWAKKRVNYVAYNGHILKWKQDRINKLNSHYGLRMYSFSDFHPAFTLENMQMITDASVRGLKMLGYTKDTDFVEIFAPSGMNINISTFGFVQNGVIAENNLIGAEWERAKELREQYPNVGITFVATDDTLVNWALDQDWIDVVIPFHLVRTGKEVAKAFKYHDYTSESSDTKTSEWTKGDEKYIAPTEHNNDKATYLAALEKNHLKPRFERFVNHPNYMKLVNECRLPASESKPVQPIFNEDASMKALAKLEVNGYYQPVGGSVDRMYEIAAEVADKMQSELAPTQNRITDDYYTSKEYGNHIYSKDVALSQVGEEATIEKSSTVEMPIRSDYAPPQEYMSAEPEVAPVVEEVTPAAEDNERILGEDLTKKNADRIRTIQAEIKGHHLTKDITKKEFDEKIAQKESQYESLSRKDTKKAVDLRNQITRLETKRDSLLRGLDGKIERANKRIESIENESRFAKRITKQNEYRELFGKLMGDTSTWKDKKMGIQYQTNTFHRNLRDIVRDASGKQDIARADAIYDELQGSVNRNEAKKNREANEVKNVFREMKINNAESTYIQMLGELRHNPDTTLTKDVVDEFYKKNKGKIDVQKVDKAIDEARKLYDSLYDRVNVALSEHGFKEIGYRKGYFPHFTDPKRNWLAKLLNWKVNNDEIPTDIAGLTEMFEPQRTWQSFDKHRKTDTTDYNFLKGLDNYVNGSLDWIYHIEDIQKHRAFENEIRYRHSSEQVQKKIDEYRNNPMLSAEEVDTLIQSVLREAKNPLNNFVTDLHTRTNILAGKKSSKDRNMESDFNRHAYSVMTNITNRVTANQVVGSISSAMTNFIPITQSWGQVNPTSSLVGMKKTIQSYMSDDGVVARSDFLTNRLAMNEALYKDAWDKIGDKVGGLMEIVDNFTSQTVWRSKYHENIKKGMTEAQAIKDADQFAENVIGGRSKGNMPTIFHAKNPVTKMLTSFQLEVANQYGYIFKDMPQDIGKKAIGKLVKGYATMFIGAYAYNALYSSLVGRDAALDPLGIIEDFIRDLGGDDDEEEDVAGAIGGLASNVADEIPFVGGLLGGGRIPISSALPYNASISDAYADVVDKDWKSVLDELSKPLYYGVMPMGGGQIRKTVQGLSMFDKDLPVSGSYTKSGNLRFPVEDTFLNKLQAGVFGQYASENARDYFDNERKPLKEKQIQEYKDLDIPIKEYWEYREGLSKHDKLADKADYIASLDLPISKKNIMINNITDRKEAIDMTNYDDFSSFEEFDYATKNPEKYAFSKAVGGYSAYKSYQEALSDISADKDENGKTINGSRKEKVLNYINGLDADYYEKIILFKSEYNADDTYNNEIIEYLNNRSDISYEEEVEILKGLGFEVDADGNIYW